MHVLGLVINVLEVLLPFARHHGGRSEPPITLPNQFRCQTSTPPLSPRRPSPWALETPLQLNLRAQPVSGSASPTRQYNFILSCYGGDPETANENKQGLHASEPAGTLMRAISERRLHAMVGAMVGGADRDRTDDPLLAKQVLSQL